MCEKSYGIVHNKFHFPFYFQYINWWKHNISIRFFSRPRKKKFYFCQCLNVCEQWNLLMMCLTSSGFGGRWEQVRIPPSLWRWFKWWWWWSWWRCWWLEWRRLWLEWSCFVPKLAWGKFKDIKIKVNRDNLRKITLLLLWTQPLFLPIIRVRTLGPLECERVGSR